jgi:methionine aminopeptidase
MKVGQVFTIEPILTLFPLEGNKKVWADNFTAISINNPNAQFEHTILIVEDGC